MKLEGTAMVTAPIEEPRMISEEDRSFFVKLGERIAALRVQQGLTQTQLAKRLEVSQKSVNAFEHGERRLPVSLLPELALALGVSIEDLVAGNTATRAGKRGPLSKIDQQMELIRRLPRARQKFVIDMLDGVLGSIERANGA